MNTIKEFEASKEKAVTGGKDFDAAEAEENLDHLHHLTHYHHLYHPHHF